MSTTLIVALIVASLLIGILVTWIIRKLVFEKNYLPLVQYDELNSRMQETLTGKALAEERFSVQEKQLLATQAQYQVTSEEVGQLKEQIAVANANLEMITRENNSLLLEKVEIKQSFDSKSTEANDAARKVAELTVKLQNQSTLYDQQKTDLELMTDKLKKDFSLLANAILDEKTQKFSQVQEKEMNTLLEPLKTNLSEFKQQVEKTYKTENEDRVSLREQVKHMMTLNETLSKEAKSLTAALSGNTKKQGDWGERVLESILDYSGLQKGIHYFTQETTNNEEGGKIRPDVLVKYPDNRAIVIDSKVSLSHYDQLCREENPDTQAILVKSLLQSLRNHIDGLSNKNYTNVTNSLDMVIMFLPVEAAYITALQNDPDLQHYAYRKNVLMVSSANLLVTMKLIYDMWNKDSINKNAEAVADKAGKLFDKLVGFVENFEKIGKAIGSLQNVYGDAHKQLASGKGNIVIQAEQMKRLKIKSTKELPALTLNEALVQDHLTIELPDE